MDQIKPSSHTRLALLEKNEYRLLYQATLDDVPNSPIVVFVQRYNADAHRPLAAKGLAPKLHYSSTDNNVRYGKRFMIVMDYIDLKPLSGRLTEQQYKCIKDAIDMTTWCLVISGDPTSLLAMTLLCSSTLIGVESQTKLATRLKSIVVQAWAGPMMWDQIALCIFIMMIIC